VVIKIAIIFSTVC